MRNNLPPPFRGQPRITGRQFDEAARVAKTQRYQPEPTARPSLRLDPAHVDETSRRIQMSGCGDDVPTIPLPKKSEAQPKDPDQDTRRECLRNICGLLGAGLGLASGTILGQEVVEQRIIGRFDDYHERQGTKQETVTEERRKLIANLAKPKQEGDQGMTLKNGDDEVPLNVARGFGLMAGGAGGALAGNFIDNYLERNETPSPGLGHRKAA